MNRWLCFFYNGVENSVCLIDFDKLAATPISHEDEIKEAIQESLEVDHVLVNGFVDISDINDMPGIVVDGLELHPRKVRVK
jgi:Glu-tRNA(Gln) amidotransferase subunit E-like FAD-binding protein